jgi:hypothetical protein
MIDVNDARPGLHVFYQQPHMKWPEYGAIVRVSEHAAWGKACVFVRFLFDTTAKACRREDLYWPPDFCAIGGGNPPGQIFDHDFKWEGIARS